MNYFANVTTVLTNAFSKNVLADAARNITVLWNTVQLSKAVYVVEVLGTVERTVKNRENYNAT